MLNSMTPDPISSMGRAVQAKTENMTPDQVAALDQQYAKMGLMSINDVLSLKQQLDYMKQAGQQQQVGPPPQTTVAQDLQSQLMSAGISTLPSNVGNEAAYARGGIVAFAAGDLVGDYGDVVDNLARRGNTVIDEFGNEWGLDANGKLRPVSGAPPSHVYENASQVGPQQTARSKARTFFSRPLSAKELGSKVWSGAKTAYPAAALLTGVEESAQALTGNPMPIENIRNYYADKGLLTEAERSGSPYDGFMGMLDDVGLRGLAMAQKMATLGFTGPERNPAPAQPPADTTNAAPPTFDLSKYRPSVGAGGAGMEASAGITGLLGRPDLSAFDTIHGRLDKNLADEKDAFANGRMGAVQTAQDEMKALGIGSAVKEGRERLAKQESELAKDEKRGKWLSAAEGFFKMAEAAGEDGATFAGAAGAGGTAGIASYNKLLDKLDRKKEQLDQANFDLAKMAEQQTMDAYGRGSAEYEATRNRIMTYESQLNDLELKKSTVENEWAMKQAEMQVQQAVAKIYAGTNQQAKAAAAEYYQMYMAAANDPELAKNPAQRAEVLKQIADEFSQLSIAASGSASARVLTAPPNPFGLYGAAQQSGLPQGTVPEFVGSRPE